MQDTVEFVQQQLGELRRLFAFSLAAHASGNPDVYSDGRPVMSTIAYGDSGGWFTRVWDADPEASGDQPGVLPLPDHVAAVVGYQFIIVARGVIEAVPLPEAD